MPRYPRDDPYEREPLDSSNNLYDSPPRRPMPASHGYSQPASPFYDASPSYPTPDSPSSSFNRSHSHDDYPHSNSPYVHPAAAAYASPAPPRHAENPFATGEAAAPPRATGARAAGAHHTRYNNPLPSSTITPGADNFSDSASGGMAGIAYSVAERNARESGVEATRNAGQVPPPPSRTQYPNLPRQALSSQNGGGGYRYDHSSYGIAAGPSGASRSSSRAPHSLGNGDSYADDPYQAYSSSKRNGGHNLGIVNPNDIEDDGDDGLNYHRGSQRNSMLSSSNSDRGARPGVGAAAAVGGAGAAGGAMGGLLGRNATGGQGGGPYDAGAGQEKSAWMGKSKGGMSKRCKLTIILAICLVAAGALIGGIVGGLVNDSKGNGKSDKDKSDGDSAESDSKKNGDLDVNSSEIKDLLDNPDLHKVFPGVDYTPLKTQYPDCIEDPPSQNNITRDVAVLSQLTNKIRLYGTDCNQTEMVIHAINQLEMKDDVKVWLGVWQDGNETTNSRQLEQMWTILDDYGDDPFEGIIVANEIIFREEMTVNELGKLLDEVRSNLTDRSLSLPVATSDLGDDWTSALASDSEYIMANIHPFFAGVEASEAASWTFTFWENNDGQFFKSNDSRNIISETGWPTAGGTDCGGADTCDGGSVAGIDELNQFMEDFVCSALANGTDYFWFEAFDEPWKIRFNEDGKEWEDKWGLMDVNRKLKDGVKIPDCGGATV